MLSFLPAWLVGVLASLCFLINMVFWAAVILIGMLVRFLVPWKKGREFISHFMLDNMTTYWTDVNIFIMCLFTKTEWDVQGEGALNRNGHYFLISNHASWLDILVLKRVFNRKTPMLVFFMKQELLWTLPVAGLACWALGFPFMRRYSKSELKKNPKRKGFDIKATHRACKRFEIEPILLTNFLEGTRCTAEKQQKQHSPFKHLLKPKAGGFAFALAAMDKAIDEFINVTVVYPDKGASLVQFVAGRMKKIIVRYELKPVPQALRGDYYGDKNFRIEFQSWLNKHWQEKDQLISDILGEHQGD